MALVKAKRIELPASRWALPPASAHDAGPVRVFDSADDAMAFLRRLAGTRRGAAQ